MVYHRIQSGGKEEPSSSLDVVTTDRNHPEIER